MPRRSFLHDLEARERRGRWFPALAGLLAIALLASTWVGLFTFMGANAAYGTFTDLENEFIPDISGMEFRFPDLSRVSRVYASGGELLAELHDGRVSEPTPISQIPDDVIHAVLAAEDSEFYQHEGVDFSAIVSAAIDNILYDTRRGGSTITQQVVKQNFVGDEVTIRRKITEAFVSAEVERRFTKDQILEFYLNSVFFGSNAYGVTAAAREFFDKDLDELRVDEAAMLAVLVRNPSLYNPRKRPEVVKDRRDSVIREMLDQGWITATEAQQAIRRPIEVQERQQFRGPADHVVAEVKRQLLNDATFAFLGETKEERTKAIFGCPADDVECEGGGGLRIETTIDLGAQQMANDVLGQWFPLLPYEENLAECSRIFPNDDPAFLAVYAESNSCAPTGAIATVDNATGAVEVMASGLPFDIEQFDLVIQGRRNPGSAFKPITAATALEEGISLGSYWDGSSPKEIQCDSPCSDGPDPFIWTVSNAGAGVGTVSLAEATYRSVNTVYAQVAAAVGPENIVDMARRMGITRSQLDPLLSITLGTSAVSPLEMATAFSNFATNGVWASPYIVSRIYDANGDLVYEHEPVTHQAADPAIFAAIREEAMVKVPTAAGTAPRANIGRPQGGKTGTHQNYQDAWFVGYVPQYTTAVWSGYEAKQIPLRNVVINGQEYSRVFGGSVPAPIWAEFMTKYLEDVPVEQFPQLPAEQLARYTQVPQVRVPSVVGLDVETAEEAIRNAGFMPWRVPIASLEPPDTVTGQSQIPGTLYEQGQTIFINVSTGDTPVGPVPGIIGSTWEEALDAFRQLEFDTGVRVTVVKVEVPGPPDRVNIVQDVDPAPGTQIEFGRTVRVYVGA